MTEERKQLYRELLHRAMIDMRAHTSSPSHDYESNPATTLLFVNALTDWLHNVALSSAKDFEGFNEEWFLRDYTAFRKQFPADKWGVYVEGTIKRLRQ